jgi:photosystem II stability/assembly factor-like uncharacterized protein
MRRLIGAPAGIAVVGGVCLALSACSAAANHPTIPSVGGSPSGSAVSVPTPTPTPTPTPSTRASAAFSVASVTFVSPDDGWVLGTVSGTLAMARTSDGGRTWTRSVAPPTHLAVGSEPGGVLNVRFANPHDGWVFDPEFWATHDGGSTWHRVTLPVSNANAIVMGLETADGLVHAAVNDENAYVEIATSPVTVDAWRLSATRLSLGAGPVPTPEIVLQGATGWIVEVDRTVIGGARLVRGRWVAWQPPCASAMGPASLAASSPDQLFAICDLGVWGPSSPTTGEHAYISDDAGATFTPVTVQPPINDPEVTSIGSPSAGVAVVANGAGMLGTFDDGRTWQTVYRSAQNVYIQYIGFEDATQGVAITEDYADAAGLVLDDTLLVTRNGGRSWTPAAV